MQVLSGILENAEIESVAIKQQKQRIHFEKIATHAQETVPFYKQFHQNLTLDSLPILTRDEIQKAADSFKTNKLPSQHGNCYPLETSGSTGKPIKVLATDFTRMFYDALMLREHRWHQRDFSKKLLAILWAKREFAQAPKGYSQTSWGGPINKYKKTGPSIFINIASQTEDQIEALQFYKPQYVNSYPSQIAALAEFCIDNRIVFPFLEEIRTTGETFTDAYKKIIYQAWPHVKITDVYSCVEVGIIAQQCPERHNYHVNTENVFLEIIDDESLPCSKGKLGKILLTSLLNYATPLIRYEVGDYGAWGECDCGRTMPVIEKIHGRKRNRLVYPNGKSSFPYLGEREDRVKITNAVRKFQLVQHNLYDIEYKIVISEPISQYQEENLKKMFQKNLAYPFNILISYHDDLPVGPNGKYEEFISLVS